MEAKIKRRAKTAPATVTQEREKPSQPGSLAVAAVLVAVTFLAYFAVRSYEFVDYDDGDYVNGNTHVDTGLTWANLKWAFTTGHASNWHPLTWVSHMLDYQFLGPHIGAHHLVSVFLHCANAVLVFLVLRQLSGAHYRSAMVAALFALHPLHVESVAWLSERKDVLSSFFLLLTVGAYGRYVQGRGSQAASSNSRPHSQSTSSSAPPNAPFFNWQTLKWYSGALFFLALGLMSKPMLVTTPFVLLLLDYWPLRRIEFSKSEARLRTGVYLILEKVPFFLLVIASSVITFIVQRQGGAVSTVLTVGQRLANAAISYVRYLGKMLLPNQLAVLYLHPGSWPAWAIAASTILLIMLSMIAVRSARRCPYVLFGWLWFLGTLVPVIGLVQVGIQSMADRYSYVPLIGIFAIIAWGVWDLAEAFRWRKEALQTVSALVLGACWLLTLRQVQFWKNTVTLFRRAVEVDPKNYLAYNNLGFYAANHGGLEEALDEYRKSIEINPTYVDALNNMGHALAGLHRHVEAVPYYEAALRASPNHAEVHNNLGNALSELGKLDEAIDHYRITLKNKPDHADAHNNLGIALAMKGQMEEALFHFHEAIRIRPSYANAHSNLGNAYAVQQKWAEAIAEYEQCLQLNPEDPQAHNNLANVLTQQGKLDDAISHYNQALTLNTNNPEAQFNLGIALLRQNKRDEARHRFEEALRLRPDYTQAREQLAALARQKK